MKSLLYYEAHVTIEPVFGEQLEHVKEIAKFNNFRVAELLMSKRKEDTPERSKYDTFMTGHGTDLNDIKQRTYNIVYHMKEAGYKVWRYKIEDTIMDSRNNDEWSLL